MTKSKEISSALREQTIGLFRGHHSLLQISKILGFPKSTIQYIKGNRMSTLKGITSEFNESDTIVSQTTVICRLKELGYQSRIPSRKPLISEVNRNKRLAFYNLYKSWTLIKEIINFEWHIKLEDFVIKCAHNFFHHASFTNI